MRHTKSRSARCRTLHILLAVPTICRTTSDTRAKTRRSTQHSKNPTYSLHLFIQYVHTKVHIYIYTTSARRTHTAQAYTQKHIQTHALTHTSTPAHTIQIILYTQIHIYIIYTICSMHIQSFPHQICDFEMRVNEMLAIVALYYN